MESSAKVRSIDHHVEIIETLIEFCGVSKPSLVCCYEAWMVESSAEDLYVLDNYAPIEFQPRETRNEGMAIYVHVSLSFQIKKSDTEIDFNYKKTNRM